MSTAPQIPYKRVSEARNVAISFQRLLDASELLSGTPTIVELITSDLTLSGKIISAGALTILGKSVAAAEAVQFHVAAGGTAGRRYKISITIGTNASTAQTFRVIIDLDVRDDIT